MLTLKNLSTAGRKRPLHALSADLKSGKIYTILGRTGAGKTELLRTVMGLDEIASGHWNWTDRTSQKDRFASAR